MNKKFISAALSFIMLLSFIHIPSFAAETKAFYVDFNSYELGAIGKAANVNGTGSKLYSTWFSIINEANQNTTDSYINRTNFVTDTTLVANGGNDKAIKIDVPSNETSAVQLHTVANLEALADTYVHFGYDIKVDDTNGRSLVLYYNNNDGRNYDFTKFDTDGTLSFNGTKLGKYVTGKWYQFDAYYDVTQGRWILFVNGKLKLSVVKKISNLSNISKLIFQLGGSGKAATTYVDNVCICTADKSEMKKADNVASFDYIPFTNTALTIDTADGRYYDGVDSTKLTYNNYEESGDVKYELKGGIFGKESSDKSLHIYNPAGYQSQNKYGFAKYQGFDSSKIEAGSKLHYSTLFAIDDNTSSNVCIEAITSNGTYSLIDISQDDSTVKSFNQTLNASIKRNQWYKLDFVITVGEEGVSNNAVVVYVNGKKANATDIEFSDNSGTDKIPLTSLAVRTVNYQTADDDVSSSDAGYVEGYTKYKSDSFWIDDITGAIYPPDKTVISPAVSFVNPQTDITVYSDRIENIGSTTVADLTDPDKAYSPNAIFFVADTDGSPVSDTSVGAKGKTLVLSQIIGGNVYLPIYHIPIPADYIEPTVSITSPQNGSEFVYGVDESCIIEAYATAYDDIENVSFYLDGNLLTSDTTPPYEYRWTIPNDAGSHTIKASITDSYGETAYSEEVNVNIISNEIPTVIFEGLEAVNNIQQGESLSFNLVSNDADGSISKTELYINNEKYDTFTESDTKLYNLSFSQNGRYILKAVTYDNYNIAGSAECSVNVVKSTTKLVGSIDFENYTIGKTFSVDSTIQNADYSGDAIIFYGDMGKQEIVSGNGGKFLKSGVSQTDIGGSSRPYIGATYNVANAVIEYETDIMFSRNDIAYNMNCRGENKTGGTSGAIHMYAVSFTKDGDVKAYNGGTNTDIGDYSANTWYRLKLRLDIPNHKYDFSLTNLADSNDKCEASGYSFTDNSYYKLININITGPSAAQAAYIGYDNIKMSYTSTYPSIQGFTDNLGTSDKVSCIAESLTCILSEAIGDITKDDIILENEYGVVTIDTVSKDDNKLIIKPKDGFVSESRYKITLKSSTPLADGTEYGFDTVAYFDTTEASFDVKDGSFTSNLSGITFAADIVNTTSQPKNVTLVTAVYKDDILIDVYSKTHTLSQTDTVSADKIAPSTSYDSVKAFVISDWSSGVPLSAKVFSFNK